MPQSAFTARKERILQQLSVPEDEYDDLSPKGSVDEGIRPLIANINDIDGLVTTSSCAGRVSIYLDGGNNMATPSYNTDEDVIPRSSASGGKGGGRWLFVSHDPLHIPAASGSADHHFHSLFGLKPSQDRISEDPSSKKFIHFKFEAMILHISTASLDDAQKVLSAALSAGFRESGAMSLNASKDGAILPMVAVRSTGLSFDALVGYATENAENLSIVDESYLHTLSTIANDRFRVNTERIERFRVALLRPFQSPGSSSLNSKPQEAAWEDAEDRKRRKKEEGLRRQAAIKAERDTVDAETKIDSSTSVDSLFAP